MLSAFIECSIGMFTEYGCGGINFISSETGILPPLLTLSMHSLCHSVVCSWNNSCNSFF
jgi:hypothetical protein